MINYFAKKGNTGIYLAESSQMDKMLAKGFDIYANDDGDEVLIATPDDGYLGERPVIGQPVPVKI